MGRHGHGRDPTPGRAKEGSLPQPSNRALSKFVSLTFKKLKPLISLLPPDSHTLQLLANVRGGHFIISYSRSSHNSLPILYASEDVQQQPEWPFICTLLDQMRSRLKRANAEGEEALRENDGAVQDAVGSSTTSCATTNGKKPTAPTPTAAEVATDLMVRFENAGKRNRQGCGPHGDPQFASRWRCTPSYPDQGIRRNAIKQNF
jgi:hypothetical protein